MTEPLYLIHIPVVLTELARISHERNRGAIVRRRPDGHETEAGFDEGRALHHLLDETFGPGVLRPFRLMPAPTGVRGSLYAYTRATTQALLTTARETGLPEVGRILALDQLCGKEMPATWTTGRRLAFDIRIRPIVRIRIPMANPRQPDQPYSVGSELDAFFVEAQRTQPDGSPRNDDGKPRPSGMTASGRSREAVYRDWLTGRMQGAAEVVAERTTMKAFKRTRVARHGRALEGPDAILHGEFVLTDPTAFAHLLAHGIGRHKAYGYGMLMLRPAPRFRLEV